jgi:hypothetical protein
MSQRVIFYAPMFHDDRPRLPGCEAEAEIEGWSVNGGGHCQARVHPARGSSWHCCRPPGHTDGPHVAAGGRDSILARWYED